MKKYYPPLKNSDLEILMQNVIYTEGYLDDPNCPYPEKVCDLMRQVVSEETNPEDMTDLDLVYESSRLFKELKDAKDSFGKDDHAEAMAYFRTSTSLLEKLVTMKERANNVKNISQFYGSVLGVMEELLEPEQITEVRNRLKEYTK